MVEWELNIMNKRGQMKMVCKSGVNNLGLNIVYKKKGEILSRVQQREILRTVKKSWKYGGLKLVKSPVVQFQLR